MRNILEIHILSAKAAIEAGADLVMTAYNTIDGVLCVASKEILTDLLRDELGFEGVVMTDGGGVLRARDVVAVAFNAGNDVSLGDGLGVFLHLEEALEKGEITEEKLDETVSRVLLLKVKRGLFDDPFLKPGHIVPFVKSGDCQKTAYDVAAASMVLLKNNDNILPLKSSQKIALIGPQADSIYHLLGDYTSPRKVGEMNTIHEEMADAILAAWYPGQLGGKAITDILLGDIQPSGRLCVSIPRGSEYLPVVVR